MRANIPIVGRSSSTVSFSSGAGTVGLRPIKVTLRDSCCETCAILEENGGTRTACGKCGRCPSPAQPRGGARR